MLEALSSRPLVVWVAARESLKLSWDDETKHRLDLTEKLPVFLIRGEHEKGNKDRELPLAPEFAEFLLDTSEDGLCFQSSATTSAP